MLRLKICLSKRWRRILTELLLIIVVVFAIRVWQQWTLVEGQAPPLQGLSLKGDPVTLSDYRGQPLLLHFWASWCPICNWEHGSIAALAEDYAVLGVAMQSGSRSELQQFMAEADGMFPVINDPRALISQRYGVRSVPTTFILDGEGNIRFREVGYSSEWGLRLRLWWLSL